MQTLKYSSIILLVSKLWMDHVRAFASSQISLNSRSSSCESGVEKGKSPTRSNEKPGWLDDAMEGIPSGEFDVESYKKGINLQLGIAGFSVDSELGFVTILVENSKADGKQKWIPVVISPVDKDRPKSAEALTCVQLAGGFDLGTAILPPDSLSKLFADQISEEGNKSTRDENGDSSVRLSLMKVTAVPNPDSSVNERAYIDEERQEIVETSPEREQAILDTVSKVEKAVKTLPGLEETTTEDVTKAIHRFADAKGLVDRHAFSSILDALRRSSSPSTSLLSPCFRLEVSIIDGDGVSQATIETRDAMTSLGLAMRYGVTVEIEEIDQHKQGGTGKESLLERFRAFRPIQELKEDSKIIDGFIPSMFEKAKLDNDMKSQ